MIRRTKTVLIACAALTLVGAPAFAQDVLFSQAMQGLGGPMGGPFVPPGELFDNEQGNGTTSLVGQDSTGTFEARTADDFSLDGTGCDSGVFAISGVRLNMVQDNAAPQPFAVDFSNDNGMGTAPESGINPFATFPETSQANLGAFGLTTSIFEVAAATPGLELDADTTYWIGGFGTDAAANAAAFNNFFAASNGAPGSTANGQVIAPDAGVADWTSADLVIGPPALAFAFAIDGECAVLSTPFDPNIPTLSPVGIGLMAGVLALLSVFVIARRRG
ncbi:MAG: hypothetical protein AAGF23_26785 [Acidobacteriota bacterium]